MEGREKEDAQIQINKDIFITTQPQYMNGQENTTRNRLCLHHLILLALYKGLLY